LSFVYNGANVMRFFGGKIDFFSNQIYTSNNVIFWDGLTNLNVGMGTATPASSTRLEIVGKSNGTAGHMLTTYGADGTTIGIAARDDGNLGIGTITPDAKLDVEGGNVRFSDYGSGTVTGTASKYLAVEADGDVIEIGLDDHNIYGKDGTLTADRTITSAGESLTYIAANGSNANSSTFDDNGNDFSISDGAVVSAVSQRPEYLKLSGAPFQAVDDEPFQIITGTNETDATTKNGGVATFHYTNVEEPFVWSKTQTTSAANILRLGGGDSGGNAATVIDLYTAADNTTTTGTRRVRIDGSGNVAVGTTSVTARFNVEGAGATSATSSIITTDNVGTETFKVSDNGAVTAAKYGAGNMTATTLSKTESIYKTTNATDGTKIEKISNEFRVAEITSATSFTELPWTVGTESIHLNQTATISILSIEPTGAVTGTRVRVVCIGGAGWVANFQYNSATGTTGGKLFLPSSTVVPVTGFGAMEFEYNETVDSGNGGWIAVDAVE
jgi:hypothetical protein